jgi:hypothetical protein
MCNCTLVTKDTPPRSTFSYSFSIVIGINPVLEDLLPYYTFFSRLFFLSFYSLSLPFGWTWPIRSKNSS